LHIVPYAYIGGTEKDCLFVIKELQNDSHKVLVLDKEGPMSTEWHKYGADVIHIDILKNNVISFFRSLNAHSFNLKPDGIFYWSTIRLPFIVSALKRFNCKLAVHVGNPANNNFLDILKNVFFSKFLPGKIESKLFACSEYVHKSILNNSYYRKFESTVSHNPVEIPLKNPHKNRKIEKSSNIKIGMVARLDHIKDHVTVIRAFARINNEYPNTVLELIGDGPLRSNLERIAKELEIGHSVRFLGIQTDIYSYLQTWDLFLYATTIKEGLGNALSEALANGLPSIVSDLPMLREIDGDVGAIVFSPPNDPEPLSKNAINVLSSYRLRESLSEKSYERARNAFTRKRYARERLDYLLGSEN